MILCTFFTPMVASTGLTMNLLLSTVNTNWVGLAKMFLKGREKEDPVLVTIGPWGFGGRA